MISLCCRHIRDHLLILQLTNKFHGIPPPELTCGDTSPGGDHRASCELGAGFDERAFRDDAPDPDEGLILDGGGGDGHTVAWGGGREGGKGE